MASFSVDTFLPLDPAWVERVPHERIPLILSELASIQALLAETRHAHTPLSSEDVALATRTVTVMRDIQNPNEDLLDTIAASAYLRTPKRTLELYRAQSRGPSYCRVGRRLFYRRVDLDRYLADCRVAVEVPR